MKKRKMSPEERAEWKAHLAQLDARISQLRELVARGEAELEARRKAGGIAPANSATA